jgi:hypothetical protein
LENLLRYDNNRFDEAQRRAGQDSKRTSIHILKDPKKMGKTYDSPFLYPEYTGHLISADGAVKILIDPPNKIA